MTRNYSGYLVVDWYDDRDNGEILGICLSRDEAEALADERIKDTDGECDVQVYDSELDKEIYSLMYERVYG